jgi:ABC-type sugar transport system permease subunit
MGMGIATTGELAETKVRAVRAKPRAGFWYEFNKKKHIYLFIIPTFIFILLFRYYPAFMAIFHAFTKWNGAGKWEWIGLANFAEMARDPVLLASIKNMAILLATSIIKILVFPLVAAELIYNLSREPARYWFRLLLTIPMIVPGIVNTLLWRFILGPRPYGLVNVLLGAMGLEHLQRGWLGDPNVALWAVVFVGFPWIAPAAMLIYYAGLQNISEDILDASQVDGASTLRRIWSIDLPLIAGQIKLQIVLTTIGTLQGFGTMLVLTGGGPGYATMVPGLWMYRSAFTGDRFGYASAIGCAMFLVMLVITYLNNKYIKSSVEYEA